MVAKAGLGLMGLGAIGIGGVAFTKPEWLGINKEVPWAPLSEDGDFSNADSGYSNKFGGIHKYYLVGVGKSNEGWWEWSFEKLKQDSADTEISKNLSVQFKYVTSEDKKVTKGFDNSTSPDSKALNQICKAIYKSDATNIKSNIESSSTTDYKESDVWKYCSGLGEKPKTISETDNDKDKYQATLGENKEPIGKDNDNRSKLVSTKGNDKFWEIREKEFRGVGKYQKIETGGTQDAFFNPEKKKEHIRDLCEQAYGKSKDKNDDSTDTEPKKDKVLKYCSLNKSSN